MAAVERARAEFGGLDVLVNNAGIGAMGRFDRADEARMRRVMEVNFFAAVEMTRLALPLLRDGRRPMVVNVSSVLGHRGVPYCAEYCASKFALQGFSQSLRAELGPLGIGVLVVSPGTTETEFFDVVIERQVEPPWPKHKPVPAAEVARQTLIAIRKRKAEIVPSAMGRMLVWLNRLAPRLVDRGVARYVRE
jgi:short-subunit dehydrogenase